MSAKIYKVPSDVTVPEMDFANFDNKKWVKDENKFYSDLKIWCQRRNPNQDHNYVGETIKFPVADGQAVYVVVSLRPLELIHSPMMDGYSAMNVDLMTVKRVKQMIDGEKKLQAFFNRVPEEAAVDKVILEIGIDTSKMSNEEIKNKCTGERSWEIPNYYVTWKDVNYLIPKFDYKKHDHEIFKFLVNKCEAHLVE
mgnify:CR=1 FL=1|jgi:hypothetical protein|tara:strand:+ start:9902 stop:10489 length:588 start_codon:yes stop_codon:yes gene_type:complete